MIFHCGDGRDADNDGDAATAREMCGRLAKPERTDKGRERRIRIGDTVWARKADSDRKYFFRVRDIIRAGGRTVGHVSIAGRLVLAELAG